MGLSADDPVWNLTSFTKNRERLLDGHIAEMFFARVIGLAQAQGLLSDEHFTVDWTLIEAWAGHKSFKPNKARKGGDPDDPGSPTVDFRGQKRSNSTHSSTTDPDARVHRKSLGTESKLCYAGDVLRENRCRLAVGAEITEANSRSEREAGLRMTRKVAKGRRITLGADKAYDTRDFVGGLREFGATPHVAAKVRYSAVDGRTTQREGYLVSQRKRKLVEEIFG
jgi:hypothetical protein